MNGIRLLLLLMASAQVEPGSERDYGWQVSKLDGALEYIIQITPDKKRAMEQQSVALPDGQENVSNMPRELIGRASRVVVRFGSSVLPREPSLLELERTPRLFEQPNVSATAMLGPGRLQDVEPNANVRNIQGQGAAPVFPSIPSALPGAQGQNESLIDQLGDGANALRNDLSKNLSDIMPDLSQLAQNLPSQPSQLGGASDFLNEARGGAAGAGGKFNNTAQPANSPQSPAVSLPNQPAKLPDFPVANANTATANGKNLPQGNGAGSSLGNGAATSNQPSYTDRFNTPGLGTSALSTPALGNQSTLPKQQTPATGFGSTPGLGGRQSSDWIAQQNPVPTYGQNTQQPYDNYGNSPSYTPSYTSAPNLGSSPYPQTLPPAPEYRIADSNSAPVTPPARGQGQTGQGQLGQGQTVQGQTGLGQTGLVPSANVDGILQVLFLLSLVVNFYLGILIRKLLIRYRSLLTNVRTQTAYT